MTIEDVMKKLSENYSIETNIFNDKFSWFSIGGNRFVAEQFLICEQAPILAIVRINILRGGMNKNAWKYFKRAVGRAYRKQHLDFRNIDKTCYIYNEKDINRFIAASSELCGKRIQKRIHSN